MGSEPPGPEVSVSNLSSTGVLSLCNNDPMLLEEQWSELFGNSREFTRFDRFSRDEPGDGS